MGGRTAGYHGPNRYSNLWLSSHIHRLDSHARKVHELPLRSSYIVDMDAKCHSRSLHPGDVRHRGGTAIWSKVDKAKERAEKREK